MPIRIYHPQPENELELILYLHGGGHVNGSLNTHDNICRRIAKECDCAVIAVDYRLAPENPYPAGVEDCHFVFNNIDKAISNLKVNTNQLFVMGDSAGGNLSLTLAHHAKIQGDKKIKGLALIYPSVDYTMQSSSIEHNGEGYILTKEKMLWYFNHYFSGPNKDKVRASPIYFEHLEVLPPTYIAVAEFDPLYDEGVEFATKLKSLKVNTELEVFEGLIHAFIQLEKLVPEEINRLVVSIAKFVKQI